MDYSQLVNDPEFVKALEGSGWKRQDSVKNLEGKIILADRIERQLNYNFETLAFLKQIIDQHGIGYIDPVNNLNHFVILLYIMCLQDMIDVSKCEPNEKFIVFEEFSKLIPTDANSLKNIMELMVSVIDRNSKTVVVK